MGTTEGNCWPLPELQPRSQGLSSSRKTQSSVFFADFNAPFFYEKIDAEINQNFKNIPRSRVTGITPRSTTVTLLVFCPLGTSQIFNWQSLNLQGKTKASKVALFLLFYSLYYWMLQDDVFVTLSYDLCTRNIIAFGTLYTTCSLVISRRRTQSA